MKKWSKFAALGLTFAMVLGTTACGSSSTGAEAGSSAEPQSQAAAVESTGAADASVADAAEEKTYEPTTLTFSVNTAT